jgi:class 3 adenylate cyclase
LPLFRLLLYDYSEEGLVFQEKKGLNNFPNETNIKRSWLTDQKVDPLHSFTENGEPLLQTAGTGPYLPRWQTSPVLRTSRVNEDLFFKPTAATTVSKDVLSKGSAILSGFVTAPPGPPSHAHTGTAFLATVQSMWDGKQVEYLGDPMAQFHIPIFDSFNETTQKPVAVMRALVHWRHYFRNILPSNVNGITVILENECDGHYTYEINGKEVLVMGFGDLHDHKFNRFRRTAEFAAGVNDLDDGTSNGIKLMKGDCNYLVHVYPSEEFYGDYVTERPIIVTFAVAMVFVFTAVLFLVYDRLVERRQVLILAKATQSTAIVSSLFPKQVRDRLMQTENNRKGGTVALASNHRLKTFLTDDDKANDVGGQPIADLFPHCTVYFADIAGFTAWSSTREPAQVFLLLQAVYQAFDVLAKRRRVFKVETIGDSYLAVTGLPEPQANHAMIMAKFTFDCMEKLKVVIRELEVTLGPDTADLSMRFGLHSGPVTAGVLRGDRARFQVFGDTVNTGKSFKKKGCGSLR